MYPENYCTALDSMTRLMSIHGSRNDLHTYEFIPLLKLGGRIFNYLIIILTLRVTWMLRMQTIIQLKTTRKHNLQSFFFLF